MSYIIKMPQMGLEMEEGEVVEWSVAEGDPVDEMDVIAIAESEKTANDIEARSDGVVRQIIVEEGGRVEPGAPIGIFGQPDEDISDLMAEVEEMTGTDDTEASADQSPADESAAPSSTEDGKQSGQSQQESQDAADVRATPGAREAAEAAGIDITAVEGTGPQGTITEADVESFERSGDSSTPKRVTSAVSGTGQAESVSSTDSQTESTLSTNDQTASTPGTDGQTESVRASPGARRLADQEGVSVAAVDGTGPEGVVIEDDVERFLETAAASTGGATRTVTAVRERSRMQQTVGARMSESHQNAPHVTLNREFDASAMQTVTTAAERADVDVSLTDLLVSAVGSQLAADPQFNALYEDGEHKLVDEVNVSVAVDVEDGLLTPVIPSVTEKSIEAVASTRQELTRRALDGTFTSEDLQGGTFTITNLGMFGVDSFDPIINPPEVAILGVGRIREDDTMTLSLSFDHRVVNGADAAKFLDGVVGTLADAGELATFFDADVSRAVIDVLSE